MYRNKVIYFPSISVGTVEQFLRGNDSLINGITSRFYTKDFPEEYYYPYFLVSAGHRYKHETYRQDVDLDDDVLVLGDSGGYQIATGQIKSSPEVREKIFYWLENNSDIAINLDVPPWLMHRPGYDINWTFDKCMDASYEHHEWFQHNKTGNTKFLTVLQGNNDEQNEIWYQKFKDFEFSGWALANIANIDRLLSKISVLIEHREFEKKHNQWLHILGISKIRDFFILSKIQYMLDEMYDGRIQLSTDSSTPTRTAAFGNYLWSPRYAYGNFENLRFRNKDMKYINDAPLPCQCLICKNITFGDIAKFNTRAYNYIAFHNLFQFINMKRNIDNVMLSGRDIIKDAVSNDMLNLFDAIEKIFLSDNPVKEFKSMRGIFNINSRKKDLGKSQGLENFFE